MTKRTGLPASTVIFPGLISMESVSVTSTGVAPSSGVGVGVGAMVGDGASVAAAVGLGGRVASGPPGVLTGSAPLETRTHPARSTTASSAREARPAWRGRDVITIWDPPLDVPRIRTRPAPVSLMVADIPVVHLKVPRGA